MREFRPLLRRNIILGVRDRWLGQYKQEPDYRETGWNAGTFGDVRKRLHALDLNTATPEDVDTAIGTTSWASNTCDICGTDHEILMQVGDEPDYEARWIDICQECAQNLATSFPA